MTRTPEVGDIYLRADLDRGFEIIEVTAQFNTLILKVRFDNDIVITYWLNDLIHLVEHCGWKRHEET